MRRLSRVELICGGLWKDVPIDGVGVFEAQPWFVGS